MKSTEFGRKLAVAVSLFVVSWAGLSTAVAVQPNIQQADRLDGLVVYDPSKSLDVATTSTAALPASAAARVGWEAFRTAHGQSWSIYLDGRSGAPMFAEGKAIPWPVDKDATVDSLGASVRTFISDNKSLFLADDSELVLDRDATRQLQESVWQVVFNRVVGGVPVDGERYLFAIGYGKLMSFGASRWSRIDASPFPDLNEIEAGELLKAYMQLESADAASVDEKPKLEFIPLRAGGQGASAGPYAGAIGSGYSSALVWRVVMTIPGDPRAWTGLVDAHTGEVRAFFDETEYAQVKGGVYPVTNDEVCPDGCEQPNWPMPFADIVSYQPTVKASSTGMWDCVPSGDMNWTKLNGHYFRIGNSCGLMVAGVTCDADMDLGVNPVGDACLTPPGASGGNTKSTRTSFYHLNRVAEHARGWLPDLYWLNQTFQINVDPAYPGAPGSFITTCRFFFDPRGGGSITYQRGSTGGCRNPGQNSGIIYHEFGHALDYNDLGGLDSPTDAYADATSELQTHSSCIGRGYSLTGPCEGYGDTCLDCTGIRDLDWDKRAAHTPATPAGFVAGHCGGGDGPCGRIGGCEGYVGGETIWDLATRDLTATGLDLASSWQIVDRLWYTSRPASGGNAWNCALPHSDGCSEFSWFERLRFMDDDDGDTSNGTPHAAAIFTAFNRHGIACGAAGDASNQSTSSCPSLGAAVLETTVSDETAVLTWTPVDNATKYRILRTELGCQAGGTVMATVAGTTYTDSGLINNVTEYYTVQPISTKASCDGPLSNCVATTPEPFAGTVKLNAKTYSCTSQVTVTVKDLNIGAGTTTASLVSGTEPTPESITLTQIAPGSDTYTGTITLTPAAPVHDGVLSVVNGDTITVTYIDAADGGGNFNIPRHAISTIDCTLPVISKVETANVTGTAARITWTTNELANSAVHYGVTPPPATTSGAPVPVLSHVLDVNGLTECTPYVYAVDSTDVVGNLATDNASGAYYAFTTGKSTQVTYASPDTPKAIPDNNPSGVTSGIVVPDARIVQDVNVTINVQHTFDGDLSFYLITPAGQTILLGIPRGGPNDDYTNTVFDDEAATTITGSAPFTGTFRPDSPLSVADGINAAGMWQFKALDNTSQDTGSILNWSLQLTYATPSCGAHAIVRQATRVADSCPTGGPGNGNTYWDAGEHTQLKLTLVNDGTTTLTGVSATVTPVTPGVTMDVAAASFPDIPAGGAADSLSPQFTAHLPVSLGCGGNVAFTVAIHSNQGSWAGSNTQFVGRATNGTGRVLSEGFDAGIPATWTVLQAGTGVGPAATWTTNNPGVRTIAAPMVVPVATVDSDAAGAGFTQDESLVSPILNLTTATTATLQFDEFFNWYAGGLAEIADVDVRSSLTGGAWVNVLRQQGAASANPAHITVDISAQAAGASNAQFRFRDWNGSNEQYWQVDNVTVDTAAPGSCDMPVCTAAAPGGAKPVPDGTFGAAMKASRSNPAGSTLAVTWDVSSCSSADHHILYGNLAAVSSATVLGAACNLGTTGSTSWTGVPAGNLWFVVVGDDNATTEGTWGTDGVGGQRGGVTASGQCGLTTRDNTGVCP